MVKKFFIGFRSLLPLLFIAVALLSSAKTSSIDNVDSENNSIQAAHTNVPQWESLGMEDLLLYGNESQVEVSYSSYGSQTQSSRHNANDDYALKMLFANENHYCRGLRFAPQSLRHEINLFFLYRFRL